MTLDPEVFVRLRGKIPSTPSLPTTPIPIAKSKTLAIQKKLAMLFSILLSTAQACGRPTKLIEHGKWAVVCSTLANTRMAAPPN